MDQTDFAIAMISGVLIIITIFLFIVFKIFGKKKKERSFVKLLPELTKIGTDEAEPVKFVMKPNDIEMVEVPSKKNNDVSLEPDRISVESGITSNEPLSQTIIQSKEENKNLKLEDILIEIREEKTKKKAKTKSPVKKAKKKPVKKTASKRKKQVIVNENPVSGEL